jgi:hypothetical protein
MCDVLDRVLWMQTWMSQEIAWIIRMCSMLFIFPYSFCGGYLHITCLSWVIRLLSNKAYKWHQLHVLHSFMVLFYILWLYLKGTCQVVNCHASRLDYLHNVIIVWLLVVHFLCLILGLSLKYFMLLIYFCY